MIFRFHLASSHLIAGGILAMALFTHQDARSEELPPAAEIQKIKDSAFQDGLNSLKNNLPLIASKQFKRSLEKQNGKLERVQQDIIKGYLAEALVRADSPQEALDLLTLLPQTPENQYWTAIALARQGKLAEALKWLSGIEIKTPPASDSANGSPAEKNAPLRHVGGNYIPGLEKAILEAKSNITLELGDDSTFTKSMESLVAMKDSPDSFRARLWLAESLAKKGQEDKAAEMLQPILQASASSPSSQSSQAIAALHPYAVLVMARIEAGKKQWDAASRQIESLLASQKLPDRIKELAHVAKAGIEIARNKSTQEEIAPAASRQNTSGSGEDQLVSFISSHPDSPLVVDALKILINEKTFLTNPEALEKLQSWVKGGHQERSPMAAYALAQTLYEKKDLDGALNITEASLEQTPDNPITHALVLRSLYWLLKDNKIEQAEQFLEKHPQVQSAQALFSAGYIAYKKGEFDKAEQLFDDSIRLGDDRIIPTALYNANLTAMSSGNGSKQTALLASNEATPEIKDRLAFEQARYAARQMAPQALGKLSTFISTHPNSPWLIPARLDLVEVCLNQTPPDTVFAQKELDKLSSLKLDEEQLFRISCLRVLLDEVQQNWPQAIAGCRGILKSFPRHPRADAIFLKLGDLLYRNGDFNETLLVLQGFPEQYPKSEYIPAALFLAGKAAQLCNTDSSLKKALELFRQLSQENGPFAQSAQIEIASLLLRTGQSQEAIELLQEMLEKGRLSRQTRLLALSIEADAWSSLSGSNPNALVKARELCTEMLAMPDLKITWKFKALSQRAQYAEKEGNLNAALSDYAEILQYMDKITDPNRRDWYWFYSAGFASLHLLEMQQKWDEALALASKLAQTTGPKAREAANIARRIKLEHFIWTEVDENETDDLHQKDIQLPVLKPLTK